MYHDPIDIALEIQAEACFVDNGVPDFEALVHSSRQQHVKTFFDTQQAAEAQKDAAMKIKDLHTTLERSDTNLATQKTIC